MKTFLKKTSNPYSLLLIVVSLLVIFILINPPIDPDMWWHLRSGEFTFNTGQILLKDQFSFTMFGQPWVNAFWFSDLIIYCLFRLAGFPLLMLSIAIVGLLTFLPYLTSKSELLIYRIVFVLLAIISISPQWTARPQVFSFLLFSCLNFWLLRWEKTGSGKLFFLPIYFILWSNVHGGFIWGIFLLMASISGSLLKAFLDRDNFSLHLKMSLNLLFWTGISALAIMINPNGFSIWKLPFHTVNVSISNIQEWASPDFHLLINHPFLWMVFLLILGISISSKKLTPANFINSVGFLYMAFVSQRNIPVAVITMTPLLVSLYSNINFPKFIQIRSAFIEEQYLNYKKVVINGFIVLLLILLLIWRVSFQTSASQVSTHFPVTAVQWIENNHPNGNLFNSYNYGGYLTWAMRDYPVFIDGRADLFGEKLISDWKTVVDGDALALSILDRFNIHLVLIEPGQPIGNLLIQYGWKLAYQDNLAIVLIR